MSQKNWFMIIIAAFLVPLFIFGIWSLLGDKPTISESENRALEPMPEFSMNALFRESFTRLFEKHYNDTFPMRDSMLSVNREMNKFFYFTPWKSDENSDNVTLVIAGYGNQVADRGEAMPPPEGMEEAITIQMPTRPVGDQDDAPISTEPPPLPELEDAVADLNTGIIYIVGTRAIEVVSWHPPAATRYGEALDRIVSALPDARIINLVTPNAGAFYGSAEYRSGIHDQQLMIDDMYEQLDESIVTVDAYSTMRYHVDEYMFFRTEHHWTQLGAYYAYSAFCDALGYNVVSLSDFETGEVYDFVGSMYTYTSSYPQSDVLRQNPDTVQWWRPRREVRAVVYSDPRMRSETSFEITLVASSTTISNKYLIFIQGDNPLIHITSDVGNGRKIAVLKESYGNAFIPFLVNHYEEVFVIDPRGFNGADKPDFYLPAFIAEHEIDDVLVINNTFVLSSTGYTSLLEAMLR